MDTLKKFFKYESNITLIIFLLIWLIYIILTTIGIHSIKVRLNNIEPQVEKIVKLQLKIEQLEHQINVSQEIIETDVNDITEVVEEVEEVSLVYENIGVYKLTAYCPCQKCCGNYSYEVTGKENHTASGTIPKANHTVAADISVLPFGTRIMIDGIIYTVEDKGGGVNGKHIDIYFDTHEEAVQFGVRDAAVYLVKEK